MNQDDPFIILISFLLCLYAFKLWCSDLKKQRNGVVLLSTFPGASPCKLSAVIVAIIGALLILFLETWGEYALAVSAEQKDITVLFLFAMISASFVEELIFRGYLVIKGKGSIPLVSSILMFSLIFAVIHPYLWNFDKMALSVDLSTKALFSTGIIFLNSIWFYTVRFYAINPENSLIPCFSAHLASNLGVFLIKLCQGHVVAWF
jgi:uncharacterized protein